MPRLFTGSIRHWLLVCGLALGASTSVLGQSVLYITDGDSSRLQAIDTTTGNIVFSATTSFLAYPIAVRNTIVLGHRDYPGMTGEYNPTTGALIGSQNTPSSGTNWTQTVDGAVNGSVNYTFAAFTNSTTVYQTAADWSNPVALFTLTGADLVGITFDSVNHTLWVSDYSSIYQYSLTGTLISQFSQAYGRGALAYQASSDTLWFVPNSAGSPLEQYSKSGTLLATLAVAGRSGNVFGAEFSAVPEPSTWMLLGLGAFGLLLWRRRPA